MVNDRPPGRDALEARVLAEMAQPVHPAVLAFATRIVERVGPGAAAVLFYGSCLRRGATKAPDEESLLDFYVLVDSYRRTYAGWLAAAANALLPPNVFYSEAKVDGCSLRAKYAIISIRQFRRGVSPGALQPALWARFAQPVGFVYCRDEETRKAVRDSLISAMQTLAMRTLPLLESPFRPGELWSRSFRETYRSELRAEGPQRALALYAAAGDRYDRCTPLILQSLEIRYRENAAGEIAIERPMGEGGRIAAKGGWVFRRYVGKGLNVLRLAKAIFTFEGGLSYVLWKVKRHSGVELTVTPWQQRHPLICSPVLAWRLYRRGAFR